MKHIVLCAFMITTAFNTQAIVIQPRTVISTSMLAGTVAACIFNAGSCIVSKELDPFKDSRLLGTAGIFGLTAAVSAWYTSRFLARPRLTTITKDLETKMHNPCITQNRKMSSKEAKPHKYPLAQTFCDVFVMMCQIERDKKDLELIMKELPSSELKSILDCRQKMMHLKDRCKNRVEELKKEEGFYRQIAHYVAETNPQAHGKKNIVFINPLLPPLYINFEELTPDNDITHDTHDHDDRNS